MSVDGLAVGDLMEPTSSITSKYSGNIPHDEGMNHVQDSIIDCSCYLFGSGLRLGDGAG
ncbi:hypothetical protein EMIT0P258_290018 [Pseudomonas sp. IT-P258]